MPTIDLVTRRPDGQFCLRVVFDRPWTAEHENLQAIQTRLYDAVEFVLCGQMDSRFPESKGAKVVIRLDCHNRPPKSLEAFFVKFIEHIRNDAEWSAGADRLLFELISE